MTQLDFLSYFAVRTVSILSSPTRDGVLTVESPVGNGRHGDAALEHRAVGEKQEGGEESSVGLEVRQHGASATQ